MEDSNLSRNRRNDHLSVNKIGKNIKKSPLHQPNFVNPTRQQPQPQVYNINKNDFRNIVQQLTGSPSQEPSPFPRPPQNPPKPASMRLQKIRPPPLTPISRPQIPVLPRGPAQAPPPQAAVVPYSNAFGRAHQFSQPSPTMMPPFTPGDSVWTNTAESPITAYMRYLQNSILDSGPRQPSPQPQHHPPPQVAGQVQPQPPPPGLLPNPQVPPFPSPRMNGLPPPPPLPSPRMNGPPPLPSPTSQFLLPSPRMNGPPPPLPSPTSQFLLPSPSGYLNLLSPRSPYPLLSPGYQFPPPLTPNFSFSHAAQSGLLGPGPQPPPSAGVAFPLSPSGFFPIPSPRWRDQ